MLIKLNEETVVIILSDPFLKQIFYIKKFINVELNYFLLYIHSYAYYSLSIAHFQDSTKLLWHNVATS